MTILVTGAFGYVGSALMKRISQARIATKTCDRLWFADALVSEPETALPDFDDFRTMESADLSGVEAIIHLAALSNDPLGSIDEKHTLALNHQAAVEFAAKAKNCGVERFVFASSCSVYGPSGAELVDEFSVTNPLTPYAKAKYLAEGDLLEMSDENFSVRILRGATVFGKSACPRTDLLLNELCAEAALDRPIRLQSDGTSWRPFMPVDDFANALLTAATEQPTPDTGPYLWNIAPPEMQMTVIEAASRAMRVAGLGAPVTIDGSGPDQRSYRVSGLRFLESFPSFSYSDDFEDQIRQSISNFSALPNLEHDVQSQRFVRLASLRKDML